MSKAYRVTKRTVMFDKQNPKTVYSVSPVNYGTLTTDDVANQIAAESSASKHSMPFTSFRMRRLAE